VFGYVRPLKGDLLVREFTRYRAVYCGICKTLGSAYGQLPRLGVNYDAVLLGILLLSLQEEDPGESAEACIANPFRKRAVTRPCPALEACAAMTVLLTWRKGKDDSSDGKAVRGLAVRAVFARARSRAAREWPAMESAVSEGIAALAALESGPADGTSAEKASGAFGGMLGALFGAAADRVLTGSDPRIREALRLLGDRIGRWVYLLDAIDDLSGDADNGNWNPFSGLDRGTAAGRASELLTPLEDDMDRTCALLPYVRDAGIVRNIMQSGLPAVREDVLAGRGLARL